MIVSYSFCLFGEFANVFTSSSFCTVQRVHFQVQVGVFHYQRILTKIRFVVFCFECKFVASAAVHFRVKRTAPNLEWNSQCKMSYIFKI